MADNAINPLTNQEVVKQGDNELRRTVQHLPAFYRTDVNQRFLGSTLDPLVQKGSLERVDGFVGRQSLELINAIYESIESSKEVFLKFKPQVCKLGK